MSDVMNDAAEVAQQPPSLGEATKVWGRIGLLSFGGPAAQIALMHREVVDQRGWLTGLRAEATRR